MAKTKKELTLFGMEEELLLIADAEENSKIDIEDIGLAWSSWENGDDEHNDEDADDWKIIALSTERCWDGGLELRVTLVDPNGNKDSYPFSSLPFEDAEECAEYIYNEVTQYY